MGQKWISSSDDALLGDCWEAVALSAFGFSSAKRRSHHPLSIRNDRLRNRKGRRLPGSKGDHELPKSP
jgi:hypothetical protein